MAEPVFEHGRLGVDRVSVEYEYEYEYRDAEDEYDDAAKPKQSDAREWQSRSF